MIKTNIRIALDHMRPHKPLLWFNIAVLGLATLFESCGMGLLIPLLQSMSNEAQNNFFIKHTKFLFNLIGIEYVFVNLIAVFTIAMLTKYFLVGLQQYLSRVLSATMIYELRDKAFFNLMKVPLRYYYKTRPGDLVATTFISTNNAGAIIEVVLMMFRGIVFAAVYIVVSCLISLPLTAVTLLLAAVSYFFIIPRFRAVYSYGTEEKSFTDETNSFLHDSVSGIKILKAFNNENYHIEQFSTLIKKYKQIQIKIMLNKILASFMLEPFAFVLVIGVLVFSVKILSIQLVFLLVFLFIFSRIIPQIKQINNNYMQINELLPHFSMVQDLIDDSNKTYLKPGNTPKKKIRDKISFKDVWFRYPEENDFVLQSIHYEIEKCAFVALVGSSGGGKTTLVDLIVRHNDPTKGAITVDGIDLREIKTQDWHGLISVVDQDPYLFNDTIFNNIQYGNLDASEDDVVRAAKMAYAHDFVVKLPKQYNTIVGNRGIKLSGGQKQRISLARALVRNPEILILDEATSALDSESERLIQKSLESLEKKKTIIVIAHRLSTITRADKILVVENGKIIEEGTQIELSEKNGRFKQLLSLQYRTA